MTRTSVVRSVVVAALLAAVLVSPEAARAAGAEDTRTLSDALSGEAKTHYDIGRILYRDGDWSGALVRFKRSYELSHEPRLAWNMAACEKNLRHYVRVLGLVEQYLRDAKLTRDEREKATAFETAVRALVGEVSITVDQPGASVLVDDEPVGRSPFDKPVLMDQGSRRVRVTLEGFRPLEQSVDVDGGGKQELHLVLEREVGHVTVRAREAEVIVIDDRRVGRGLWSGTLPVGPHVLVVSAPSGKTRRVAFPLADRERREFVIEVDSPSSGMPRWVYFAGGGVLAAGAAVGAWFLFKPKPAEPTPGTLGAYQVP